MGFSSLRTLPLPDKQDRSPTPLPKSRGKQSFSPGIESYHSPEDRASDKSHGGVRFSGEHERCIFFRTFDSNLSALVPLLSSPRKRGPRGGRTGKQGKMLSTVSSRIWIPASAGMTKSGIAFRPNAENRSKRSTQICRRLPHTFARDSTVQNLREKPNARTFVIP
jgi:hypothetical protein